MVSQVASKRLGRCLLSCRDIMLLMDGDISISQASASTAPGKKE